MELISLYQCINDGLTGVGILEYISAKMGALGQLKLCLESASRTGSKTRGCMITVERTVTGLNEV